MEDVTAFDNIDKMEAKIDASSFAIDRPRFCRGVVNNSSLLLLSYLRDELVWNLDSKEKELQDVIGSSEVKMIVVSEQY